MIREAFKWFNFLLSIQYSNSIQLAWNYHFEKHCNCAINSISNLITNFFLWTTVLINTSLYQRRRPSFESFQNFSWNFNENHFLSGCYYQYQHYDEGEQIRTSEPCLNCTCHNQMLMCYLRVCPFIKPVGKNCVVEKREDQCCPTIMCPEGNH